MSVGPSLISRSIHKYSYSLIRIKKKKILVSRIDRNDDVTVASLAQSILNNVWLVTCLNFWHTCS